MPRFRILSPMGDAGLYLGCSFGTQLVPEELVSIKINRELIKNAGEFSHAFRMVLYMDYLISIFIHMVDIVWCTLSLSSPSLTSSEPIDFIIIIIQYVLSVHFLQQKHLALIRTDNLENDVTSTSNLYTFKQGKSEGFDSCDWPSNLTQIGLKSSTFQPVWPWKLMDDLEQGKSEGFDSCDRPSNLKLDSNRQFFRPCDHEIWWMTLQNNRAPLLCYFKLCAAFPTHWWIQTWVTVRKRSIRVKIDNFLSCVT